MTTLTLIREYIELFEKNNLDKDYIKFYAIELTQGHCIYSGQKLYDFNYDYKPFDKRRYIQIAGTNPTVDHLLPISYGNPAVIGNVAITDKKINSSKGNKNIFEFYKENFINNNIETYFKIENEFIDFVKNQLNIYKNGEYGHFYNLFNPGMSHEEVINRICLYIHNNIDLSIDKEKIWMANSVNKETWEEFQDYLINVENNSEKTFTTSKKGKIEKLDESLNIEFGEIDIREISEDKLNLFLIKESKRKSPQYKTLFSQLMRFLGYNDTLTINYQEWDKLRTFFDNNTEFDGNNRHLNNFIRKIEEEEILIKNLNQEIIYNIFQKLEKIIKKTDKQSIRECQKVNILISKYFKFDYSINYKEFENIKNKIINNNGFDLLFLFYDLQKFVDENNIKIKELDSYSFSRIFYNYLNDERVLEIFNKKRKILFYLLLETGSNEKYKILKTRLFMEAMRDKLQNYNCNDSQTYNHKYTCEDIINYLDENSELDNFINQNIEKIENDCIKYIEKDCRHRDGRYVKSVAEQAAEIILEYAMEVH